MTYRPTYRPKWPSLQHASTNTNGCLLLASVTYSLPSHDVATRNGEDVKMKCRSAAESTIASASAAHPSSPSVSIVSVPSSALDLLLSPVSECLVCTGLVLVGSCWHPVPGPTRQPRSFPFPFSSETAFTDQPNSSAETASAK